MGLGLTQFDIIVLVLLLISAGVGFARGAMREIIALAALVVGALVAIFTLSKSAPAVRHVIHPDWLGTGVALIGVFLLVYLVVRMTGGVIARQVQETDFLGALDRSIGLAIGLASALTPVYIAEIAPAKNRGTLVSLNQLAIVVGILTSYLVNWQLAKLGDSSWRWMLASSAIPAASLGISSTTSATTRTRWCVPRWMSARRSRPRSRSSPTGARAAPCWRSSTCRRGTSSQRPSSQHPSSQRRSKAKALSRAVKCSGLSKCSA